MLRDIVIGLRLMIRGATVLDPYQAYLRHHRIAHPGEPPLSAKEWWDAHHAAADKEPGARCC